MKQCNIPVTGQWSMSCLGRLADKLAESQFGVLGVKKYIPVVFFLFLYPMGAKEQ